MTTEQKEPQKPQDVALAIQGLREFTMLPPDVIRTLEDFSAQVSRVGDDLFIVLNSYGVTQSFTGLVSIDIGREIPITFSARRFVADQPKSRVVLGGGKEQIHIEKWDDKNQIGELEASATVRIGLPAHKEFFYSDPDWLHVWTGRGIPHEFYPLKEQTLSAFQEYTALLQELVKDILEALAKL